MAKKEIEEVEVTEIKFSKEQILSSKRFRGIDAASVVLKDGETYTLNQVDDLIEEYMNSEVK